MSEATNPPNCRFFGSVVRTSTSAALPWGSLSLTGDEAILTSGLRRRYVIRRSETGAVEVTAVRLIFMVRSTIRFLDHDRRKLGPLFVPYRTKRVRQALSASGWPLEEGRLGLLGRKRSRQ